MKIRASRGHDTPKKSSSSRRTPGSSDASQLKKIEQQTDDFVAYSNRKRAFDACTSAGTGGCTAPGDAVDFPDALVRGQGPAAPQISPQQAAYVAVAQLRLTPPKPVIGPSPEINEWNMAAVGYPYWLWAEGNLDPAPVSTTVADLTVSLDAHLASTTFDLGDGTRLTCTDLSARWTPAVEPAAPSPACGHTYTKPSLPKGRYTITAYSTWSIDWSVNGVGGTIPLYQQASTTVPVGELQVLTR
ncbi:hypothetical protein GCM10009593_24950 [Microlunatus antarcticus]